MLQNKQQQQQPTKQQQAQSATLPAQGKKAKQLSKPSQSQLPAVNNNQQQQIAAPVAPSSAPVESVTPVPFPLTQIISGGETGADRGGLMAGKQLKLKTGGIAHAGYKTENGLKDAKLLMNEFKLQDLGIDNFKKISQLNVDNSNATIAFRLHVGSGTDKTIHYCLTKRYSLPGADSPFARQLLEEADTALMHIFDNNTSNNDNMQQQEQQQEQKQNLYRPVLIIRRIPTISGNNNSEQRAQVIQAIRDFIVKNNVKILNIAGHRESTAGVPNFGKQVCDILFEALQQQQAVQQVPQQQQKK